MHADVMRGVVVCKATYPSAGLFLEEIMVLIKHGISEACGSLEDAMYFLRRGKQMFPFTKIVMKNVSKICMY